MTAPARPVAPAPVTPLGAAVWLAGAMVVAALLSVSVARTFPADDGSDGITLQRDVPFPLAAAPAPGLEGVAPLATFADVGAGLAPPLTVEAGSWATADGQALATDVGAEGALAVLDAPADATTAQVTLAALRPGAGLVVDYIGPGRYVALVVGRTGQTVELVEVGGDVVEPARLIVARMASATGPLVLALRRDDAGLEAYANGDLLGRRFVSRPGGPWRVGMVTGFRARADEARFDDLTVV